MIEIEMKFVVADLKQLRQKLLGLQAVAEPIEQHVDAYYRHPCRDFVTTGEVLRIRRVNGRPSVTYKGPREPSADGENTAVKVRKELEWPLSPGDRDGSKMALLLDQLGFTKVAEVPKRREPFEVLHGGRQLTVTIDTVDDLGVFAEVECMAEADPDREAAVRAIEEIAKKLALSEPELRSYLRMKLEQQGR
ncbi:class IV adenylate cyclase [Candidatus Laterigemmans baculatus]|uniref:class IV adenylate cyclase n=1 Tax=Candidatus Laterigemmans baculatus TaxID=2770505 RepID=UPI0013DA7961|nr:class IV adenylate cyclase [Candidatus Laterigemmans baculatus]